MTNWKTIEIGEILKLSNKKSTIQNQFPVLTSSRGGLYLQSDYFKKIVASKNNVGYKIIKNGQFTYRAMSDDGYFKFNRLVNQIAGIISPAYEVFDVNENYADATFIDYLLNSIIISSQIYSAAQGGTRLALRFGALAKFVVKLPPLNEQKKIAEIISGIDKCYKLRLDKIRKLKIIKNALIQDYFSISTSNEWVRLGDVSDLITSGSRGWGNYYSNKGSKFVRIGNLKRDSIDMNPNSNNWKFVSLPQNVEGKRTELQKDDLLISITADLGICCVYSSNLGESYVNQHIALVRLKEKFKPLNRFFAYFISSDFCQNQIELMNDSGTKAGLNLNSIRNIQLPCIQKEVAQNIFSSLDAIQLVILRNQNLLASLDFQKSAIASNLLQGSKRVKV